MTNVIKLTHPPPRKRRFDKKTLAEARKIAGHTRRFAEEAPEWHRALVTNIARKLRDTKEASQ